MTERNNEKNGFDRIPFRMHPRVFAALGADLVTNDVVAVIELVKNSYDAFATNVWLRFSEDPDNGAFLEIEDDGIGMPKEIIEDVWCLVATPYKETNPVITSGHKTRRVAGEKGLGRLSVARLGDRLAMLTQAEKSPCLEVTVNWTEISGGDRIEDSFAGCRRYPGRSPFEKTGTILRIFGLNGNWDDNRISDLQENLARLISPFSDLGDFNIYLADREEDETEEIKIESPDFLATPKYSIEGDADKSGNISCKYRFQSFSDNTKRKKNLSLSWERLYDSIQDKTRFQFSGERARCGPFSFEIRAWDISSDDTQELSERFKIQKSLIRKAIRAHKGISVYRDGVLVLPKSDQARDWLGLDLRRVSKVGTRMSTSQLVGYVSISAEENSSIEDTSDRERLASCLEVAEFEEILKAVVALLENERDADRIKPDKEKPMEDLFESLSAEDLLSEVVALSEEGAGISEAVPLLQAFSKSLDAARMTIQKRFYYYSRVATVGTIAQMLVHEIRNRTIAFGLFLDFIKSRYGPFKDKELEEEYRSADGSVNALERLADTFAPLASRTFKRRKRNSVMENQIRECLYLQRTEIRRKGIKCCVPDTETPVAADPGELDAILLNIITNAIYWLGEVPKGKREIEFKLFPINEGERIRAWINDTGPGIDAEYKDKIFWPGITRKPGGIGMGLTVASELVAAYGGRMSVQHPGKKGGASFAFDLPLKK